MQAAAGDRIIIRGNHVGQADRDCEVIEVRGHDGEPPYVVKWEDSGAEALFFPGPDAEIRHLSS